MTTVESAWPRYPGYEINLVPIEGVVTVRVGDLVVAESTAAVTVQETDHKDRVYLPESDVRWAHFTPTDTHTICPFKGEADYWTLHAVEPALDDVVWTYREVLDEVAGLVGLVCFYQERTTMTVAQTWPDGTVVTNRCPAWGDANELLALIDVEPGEIDGSFVGPRYRNTDRNVVEGGQMLGQAIVAASKMVSAQRVVSAHMLFPKAASFDKPLDIGVDVLRHGRSFSTIEVRIAQDDALRSVGTLLLDAGADDVMRHSVEMPDVPGPEGSPSFDFAMTGRDIRVVGGMYDALPDRVAPPVIHTWSRYRDAPGESYLHAALLAQSTTHWTIAAGMLPHAGFSETDAHVTLSTGVMSVSLAFHDEFDITDWLLYETEAISAGRGLVQGAGRVFSRSGALVASSGVQAIVRSFPTGRAPAAIGLDSTSAM